MHVVPSPCWSGFCFSFLVLLADLSRVWVVGDSIVFWAGRSDPRHSAAGRVTWLGVRGAKLSTLMPAVHSHLKSRPVPQVLIVHVGTNDIFSVPVGVLRRKIEGCLNDLRTLLPNTRIIWSDILPRLFYHGERTPGAGKLLNAALNRYAHSLCRRLGVPVIVHYRRIIPGDHALFRRDGLHLFNSGNTTFRDNIYNALEFFRAHPHDLFFPSH